MPALYDDPFVIGNFQRCQGGIRTMDGLEFAHGHRFEFFGIFFLHRADDIGMAAENVRVNLHAIADGRERGKAVVRRGLHDIPMSLIESFAHRVIGQSAGRNHSGGEHHGGGGAGLDFERSEGRGHRINLC